MFMIDAYTPPAVFPVQAWNNPGRLSMKDAEIKPLQIIH
jgi:hypothetical protein